MSLSMYLAFAVLSLLQISDVFSDDTSFSGDDFYVGMKKVSRSRALSECEEKSMKLVSIETEDKNVQIGEFLHDHGGKLPYWTSGYRESNAKISGIALVIFKATWLWLNEAPMKYFNWAADEPNGNPGMKVCIEVVVRDNDLFWNDNDCSARRKYVCEKTKEE